MRALAWVNVVSPGSAKSLTDVYQSVESDRNVLSNGPRCRIIVIARGNQNGETALRRCPDIFKDISLNENPLCVFEFQKILDTPQIRTVLGYPRKRLEEMIAPNLDVRGDEVRNGRIGSPAHKIFPGCLKIVVNDLQRAGRVV